MKKTFEIKLKLNKRTLFNILLVVIILISVLELAQLVIISRAIELGTLCR